MTGRMGMLLVVAQFGLIGGLVYETSFHTPIHHLAIVGAIASIGLGFWTLRHNTLGNFNIRLEPKTQGRLIVTGPYQWVRHPMYTALLLGAGALVWQTPVLYHALLLTALVVVLFVKSILEERSLVARWPEYVSYQHHTWRFIPSVW